MSFGTIATVLIVVFVVFIFILAGELLYVVWHEHSFRRRSSPPPPIRRRDEPPTFPITVATTKELLYFFGLKPHTQVGLESPAGVPNKNKDGSSPDDHVVDVLKLFDAKRKCRILGTNKEEDEEDKEEVESEPEADFSNKSAEAEAEAEEVVAVTVDRDDGNTKTVFSTPCDSPMFFTPEGSP